MRTVKLLAAAAVGLLFPLVFAAPASAGGPTSALLVAPDSNAVGLYNSDPEYEELSALVDSDDQVKSSGNDRYGPHAEGPFITVTWMIHDVQVWRVDRIYYEADGGPWIYTIENQYNKQTTGVWHRSPHTDRLTELLQQLNLTDGEYAGPLVPPAFADEQASLDSPDSSGEVKESADSRDHTNEAAAPAASKTEPPTTDDDGAARWWWAGGGVLTGLLVAAAIVRLYPILRSARPERQQLVDF